MSYQGSSQHPFSHAADVPSHPLQQFYLPPPQPYASYIPRSIQQALSGILPDISQGDLWKGAALSVPLPLGTCTTFSIPIHLDGSYGMPLSLDADSLREAAARVNLADTSLNRLLGTDTNYYACASLVGVESLGADKQPGIIYSNPVDLWKGVPFTVAQLLMQLCECQVQWFKSEGTDNAFRAFLRNAKDDPLWEFWRQDPRIEALHVVAIRMTIEKELGLYPIFVPQLEIRVSEGVFVVEKQ